MIIFITIHLEATGKYLGALARWRRPLEKQQVRWVVGRHLPRPIALAEAATVTEAVPGS